MFQRACFEIRKAIYGVIGTSKIGPDKVSSSNGTGFMIAPGVLATAAHLVHIYNDPSKPIHLFFEAIRAPDIGQPTERALLIAEDPIRDIALLRIDNPRSNICVALERNPVPIGTDCGSLGFPLARITFKQSGKSFHLVERFQGANISAFHTQTDPSGHPLSFYETDALMYRGSSGCPGFLEDANVFGMHNKSVIEKSQVGSGPSSGNQIQTETRLAISLWVPSMDIIAFAVANGVKL